MNIVFMGTPAFAIPALHALLHASFNVCCVYTQPPRPAGRGHKEKMSEIHQLALLHHLPVRTPSTLRDPQIQQEFAALSADVAVVAAYGLLLPVPILTAFPKGCINIHPSLLPRWRGAAPIQRPLLMGDKETGVAIMQMDKGLDTGDILMMEKLPIADDVTAGELHDMLAKKGAELLVATLKGLMQGSVKSLAQATEGVTYAAKITKEEGNIDWHHSAVSIERRIRAFTPWPGAYFKYAGEQIRIIKASWQPGPHHAFAGTVLDDQLTIACGEGVLQPLILQRPGRKAVDIAAFLRGFSIPKHTVLDVI